MVNIAKVLPWYDRVPSSGAKNLDDVVSSPMVDVVESPVVGRSESRSVSSRRRAPPAWMRSGDFVLDS